MPENFHFVGKQDPALKSLASKAIAQNKDFLFLKYVVCVEGTPEFGGCQIIKLLRKQEEEMESATQTMYRPLIDMISATQTA